LGYVDAKKFRGGNIVKDAEATADENAVSTYIYTSSNCPMHL
jgi:hypothetical protein